MIDALFGSKTRVKLLHLFLNNPGKAFYVREITRLIDEQINSVRRELSNLLEVGVIGSTSADNKLYYEVNRQYQFYEAFRSIFADQQGASVIQGAAVATRGIGADDWGLACDRLPGVRVAIAAGALIKDSASKIDLLIAGSVSRPKVRAIIKNLEKKIGRELNYSVMSYDEFYYRLSVRDKFIAEVLAGNHAVLVDTDNIVN